LKTNLWQIAETLSEPISALIAATSETTLGSLNNGKGDENSMPGCVRRISHAQASEDRQVDEDVEMSDTGSVTQTLRTEPKVMRRTSSLSSRGKRLADRRLWGHIDPRTEWPESQEVVCDERMDIELAARRARNRQLGKCLEKRYFKRRKLRGGFSGRKVPYWRILSKGSRASDYATLGL
jgi:hypothetical protein